MMTVEEEVSEFFLISDEDECQLNNQLPSINGYTQLSSQKDELK